MISQLGADAKEHIPFSAVSDVHAPARQSVIGGSVEGYL